MHADELRARHAEAKAQSRLLLDPEAYRAAKTKQAGQRGGDAVVVQRQAPPVVVERRTHDGIGWSPPPLMAAEFVEVLPPLPKVKPPTIEEVKRIVRDELATCQAQIGKVADTLAEHKLIADARRDAMADFVADVRKQLRREIAKSQTGNELFYTDENGVKQDAELHKAIINPVDYPIDEKIMGPIRARHRAKWLAERKAKRAARVIDLPALPLRNSRRA